MVTLGATLMEKFLNDNERNQQDSAWQGDDLSSIKDPQVTRLMFHNVNGLSLTGVEGIDMFVNEQANLFVDVQGFSEHCLDTTKFRVSQSVKDTVRQQYPGKSSVHLQSSSEQALNIYKPGGTGLLLLGNIIGRQEPQGMGGDPMGRWSFVHLRRKDLPPVTIIAAYQVCPRPTNPLGNTAYHQQIRALSEEGRHNIHPRQAFTQDLGKFISSLQTKGHDIILGGDFNEALEDKNSGILHLLTKHNLIDPFLSKFPHHEQFGTHIHGKRRIDAVYLTPQLMPGLLQMGYAPFQFAKSSDHRPVLLDFDTKTLFGQRYAPMQPQSLRTVKTKDKKAVSCFVNRWYDEVLLRRGFTFLKQIDDDSATSNIVEMVDEIIGKSADIAENVCKRRRPEFYSDKLVQQRMKVSILRGHLNSLRLGRDRTKALLHRMRRSGADFDLPPTERTSMVALRQACQELRETCRQHQETRQAELQIKIDQASHQGNKTKAKILQNIRRAENTQKTYQILKAMRQKSAAFQSLDRIEIPASWPAPTDSITSLASLEDPKICSSWRLVTNPKEVEYYLMLRN